MELEDVLRRRRMSQPRTPMDERLPDGRSVAELMAGMPALSPPPGGLGPPPPVPVFNPTGVPPPGGPVADPRPPARMGVEVPANASNLQRLMAQHTALSQADPSSPVRRADWGYEELPPERSPSRLRHAGMGAATGAILAGQATKGDPWGTLAGAAVGALTGGISPALMQAFQRRQELDQSTGDLAAEQSLQLRNAQIGETLAQADQRRLDPLIEAEKLRQQRETTEMLEGGRNRRADASNRTRVETASEANRLRRESLEERQRHNKAVENRPGTATEEITVAGRKFKVPPATAARILEDRQKSRAEVDIEADLETEAANDHLTRRREADETVSRLRAEREKLTHGSKQLPDGTWGWQEDPRLVDRNSAAIRDIDRQIAETERESAYRQKEADDAFSRARKAKAKAGSAGAGASSGGGGRAFDLGRWKRDHPGADPSAVIQRAKDADMRIIE